MVPGYGGKSDADVNRYINTSRIRARIPPPISVVGCRKLIGYSFRKKRQHKYFPDKQVKDNRRVPEKGQGDGNNGQRIREMSGLLKLILARSIHRV